MQQGNATMNCASNNATIMAYDDLMHVYKKEKMDEQDDNLQ